MSAPSRRGLLAAGAALMGAATIGTAAATAAVGPHPDADLVAVCAQFEAIEADMRATCDNPLNDDDDVCASIVAGHEAQLVALLDVMGTLTAQTAAGIQARARLLATHNGNGAFSWDAPDTMAGRLLGFLLRDVAAMGDPLPGALTASRSAAASDAALIETCAAHTSNRDAFNAGPETDFAGPQWAAYCRTRDAIDDAKPQTMAGVLAKAAAAKAESVGLNGEESWHGTMGELWACDVVNDLLRLAGRA